MQQPYQSVLRLLINKFMKTLKMAGDNALSSLTPLSTEKLLERTSFHLTDTSSLLYQLHITLTMYTGIPVDSMELYSLKWLTRSKALERSKEAANTKLPLAIKWSIVVFKANKASAHPVFCLKPNCNWSVTRKSSQLLRITNSKSWDITGTRIISLSYLYHLHYQFIFQ